MRALGVTLLTLLAAALGSIFAACGARTGLALDTSTDARLESQERSDVEPRADAPGADSRLDAIEDTLPPDAPVTPDGPVADAPVMPDAAPCAPSTVVGDVFGKVRYFASGSSLPAGRYRVKYVDGCMKYGAGQAWSVNAYGASGTSEWWLVDDTSASKVVLAPGTIGFELGSGGFASFDACVAANEKLPALDFHFDGGRIGLWLEDNPYSDNSGGPDGKSPTWQLECLD